MNAPMHFMPPADFRARVSDALQDTKLRGSMRGAMDFLQDKRRAQFPDGDELEQLRDLGEAVRQHALANLPQLLVQFEAKLQAAGAHVHWAEVRTSNEPGWYFKDGSTRTGVPASKPPTYPTQIDSKSNAKLQ